MFQIKTLIFLNFLLLVSSCATSEGDRRVDELRKRAHKDLYCDREDVTVALLNTSVIGASGCGRTRYYSVIHPFN